MTARRRAVDVGPPNAVPPSPTAASLPERLAIPFALLSLYIIWGSTYLAIRIAVQSIPPFYMAGTRFLLAGALLYGYLRARGAPSPSWRQWGGAALVGTLLLVTGNAMVGVGEQSVASGLAAVLIATVPLWAALFAGLWGLWPGRVEAGGLVLGFAGVALLNLGSGLHGHPFAAAILVFAAISWAFGSVWSRHLPIPHGMMASAAEMLTAGAVLLVVGFAAQEPLPVSPSSPSAWAVLYLITFGSFVGFSSYNYLLQHVRPALATSYAYVNPLVAVGLGAAIGGEQVGLIESIALVLVLSAVALVVIARQREQRAGETQSANLPTAGKGAAQR